MDILAWLVANREGIVLLGQVLVGVAILAIVACWTFGWGRFRRQDGRPRSENLRYLITEALTKIINDFRHLLALLLVVIFGLALAYAMAQAGAEIAQIKEALQAVTSTLGGLVGSIIGYYFGESKGRRSTSDDSADGPQEVLPQNPAADAADITPAKRPPADQ